MRRYLLPIFVFAVILAFLWWGACAVGLGLGSPKDPAVHEEAPVAPQVAMVAAALPRPTAKAEPVDPYAGWGQWCEPLDYDIPCKTHEDCEGAYPDHPARRPMRCFNPWYAKSQPEYKVCAPGFAGKRERQWRRDRLREVIRQQYFGEVDTCKLDGRPMWKEGWRCQKADAQGEKLLSFLWIGYIRETTGRPWKRHRLDADVKASRTAWYKMAEEYGWTIETDDSGEVVTMAGEEGNPHYGERYRWHFGLGPIGQNAPLWVHNWDPDAPPEILCREVEPFESYLRRSRAMVRTLRNGIRCGGSYYEDRAPTWETLHRAVNLGSPCPPSTARHRRGLERFRRHAEREGLDPGERVTLGALGEPIPVDGQNERAAEIYAVLERQLPRIQ